MDDTPVEPKLSPKEVASRVDTWERTKHPTLDQLLADVFGRDQMEDVSEFIELSRAMRERGM